MGEIVVNDYLVVFLQFADLLLRIAFIFRIIINLEIKFVFYAYKHLIVRRIAVAEYIMFVVKAIA